MNRILKIFVFALAIFPALKGQCQLLESRTEAFSISKQFQRPVLLVFSGSDWCQPCIRFHQVVLADSGFMQFSRKNLVILQLDFPQRKKQSAEIIAQNESMADRYNPSGEFPKLVLLRPDQTILAQLDYKNESAMDFIAQISNLLAQSGMLKEYSRQERLMGSAFEFIVVADEKARGEQWLNEAVDEVARIEALLTEFNDGSETSLINKNAGKDYVHVSGETYGLIERAIHISRLTKGNFDITSGILKKLYKFRGEEFSFPSAETIRSTLAKTGYKKIRLESPDRVMLEKEGMHIGFGAIGKGYAADKVRSLLMKKGVTAGVINASGDLTAWGTRPDGQLWRSGIAHPDYPEQILLWLPINGNSIATSGNYIQFFEKDGIRYSHNINPLTGMPSRGIKSVTIISPSAELCDALATAVTIMGCENGLDMVDQLPQTHCLVVDDNNKVYRSRNINVEHAG